MIAIISLCASFSLSGPSITGHWPGRLLCDSPTMMRKAKTPEHRKLLKYTIRRLGQAKVSFDFGRDHRFAYSFDDGYVVDRETASGTWAESQTGIVLTFDGSHRKRQLIRKGPRKLVLPFNDIEGVSAVFQR